MSANSVFSLGWASEAEVAAIAEKPAEMERSERRINGNVYVTLTGEATEVDAATVAFVANWGWAYGARVEGRVRLADGRVRATLFRYAAC